MKTLTLRIMLLILMTIVTHVDAQDNQTPSNDLLYVTAVSWNSDGTKIAAVGIQEEGKQGYLRIIDTQTGKIIYQLDPQPGGFTSVVWSPDNRFIAAGGYDGAIWVIDVEKESVAKALYGHRSTVSDLDWNEDGTRLVSTGNWDGLTILWDMITYQQIRVVESTTWYTMTTAFSPNYQQIAVGGEKGIRIYSSDTDSKQPIWANDQVFYIGALAWNHKGDRIAVGSQSFQSIVHPDKKTYAQLYILDATNGSYLKTIDTQDDTIFGVAWNLDDSLIATYSKNGYVRIWEVASGSLLQSFLGTTVYPEKLAFSPYGGRLAYGNSLPIGKDISTISIQPNAQGIQSLVGGAVQVIVPEPSPERLQAIAQSCGLSATNQQTLLDEINGNRLDSFNATLQAIPKSDIPAGCADDLLAVANALKSS